MSYDSFYRVNARFCESYQYSDDAYSTHWEPTNFFSALFFITPLGLHLSIAHQHYSMIIYMISGLITMNGPFSAAYHFKGWNFLGNLDILGMFIASILGNLLVLYYNVRNLTLTDRRNYKLYKIITVFISLIFPNVWIVMLSLMMTSDVAVDASTYFAITQCFLALQILFIPYIYEDADNPDTKYARWILYRGALIAIISGIFWAVTEHYCREHQWITYMYSHAIWHLTMAYAQTCMLTALIFFTNFDEHLSPYLLNYRENRLYRILPVVRTRNNPGDDDSVTVQ